MNLWLLEDEPRAARRMQRLLLEISPELKPSFVAESVAQAVQAFGQHPYPDLIISDIQLADGLSFEFFNAAKPECPVVFTTAYDHYALEAFRVNGVDYLLKPINEEDLKKAIEKARKLQSGLDIAALQALIGVRNPVYKERFMVKAGEKIRSISVDEISCIYSDEKHTMLRSGHREYVVDQPLDALVDVLSDQQFFRISRKFIVSHQSIVEVTAWSNSRLKVQLEAFDRDDLIVARDRVRDFRIWMGA